jgi:hypothetical protein
MISVITYIATTKTYYSMTTNFSDIAFKREGRLMKIVCGEYNSKNEIFKHTWGLTEMSDGQIKINYSKYVEGDGFKEVIDHVQEPKSFEYEFIYKLDQLFQDLKNDGILAFGNYSCCSSCGHTDMFGKIDEMTDFNYYIFYQKQDMSDIITGSTGIYIKFGAKAEDADDVDSYNILNTILEKKCPQYGLEIEWDKDPETSMLISVNLNETDIRTSAEVEHIICPEFVDEIMKIDEINK